MVGIACLVVGVLILEGVMFAFSPSTCLIAPNATASCVERIVSGRGSSTRIWHPLLTNVTLASDGSACPLLFFYTTSIKKAPTPTECWDAWAGCRGQPGQCDIAQYDASLEQVTCYGPEKLLGRPSCTLSPKPMMEMSSRYAPGMAFAIAGGAATGIGGLFLLLCVLPSACRAACSETQHRSWVIAEARAARAARVPHSTQSTPQLEVHTSTSSLSEISRA